MQATPEIIEALAILRTATSRIAYRSVPDNVKQAINTLDNAGVFAQIDGATGYDVSDGCSISAHANNACTACGQLSEVEQYRDPAEYGDLAFRPASK